MTDMKFKSGDIVTYTNSNGVDLGLRKIVDVTSVSYCNSGWGYYIEPTDTPWFAVPEECLTKESE